jgi:hypothetical protein
MLIRSKRRLTSSKVKDYSDFSISKGPKVLNLSQIQEQKRQIDERRKKKQLRKFFFFQFFGEHTCIKFFSTGLTTRLRQTIAESAMIANKPPDIVDWTIIPDNADTFAPDEYMDVDLQLDEWEDVVEEDLTIDIQDEVDRKMAARHTSLQTTITCVILIFLCNFFFFSQLAHHYCSSFGGSRKSYVTRSRLLRRRHAESEWDAVVPTLVDPYLAWKSTRAMSRPEMDSDFIWPIPVLGLKGL